MKTKNGSDAGIGLFIDLLKFLGPSVGDKNRVVFAIISSMTHVDEYSVHVCGENTVYDVIKSSKMEGELDGRAVDIASQSDELFGPFGTLRETPGR